MNTATEQQIARETGWVLASEHISGLGDEAIDEMCSEDYGWVEGEQFRRIGGAVYVNPEACRKFNIEAGNPDKLGMHKKKTALYRHYNDQGELLYVGISLNPIRRVQQHENSAWWDEITRIEIERYENRRLALEAETAAIASEKPVHNVHQNVAE